MSLHSALLQFASISQKRAYVLIWSPSFMTATQGTPPDHLGSEAYTSNPTVIDMSVYF